MHEAPPPAADWVAALLSAVANSSATQQLQLNSTQATTSLTNIRRLILDHGAEAVARDLQQHVQNTTPLACKAVKTVLSALRSSAFSHTATAADAAACAALRSQLFSQLPSWVHNIPVEEQQFAGELVTAAMPDVEHLSADELSGIMTAVLSGLEQKQPHACVMLELLPACLAALQAAPGPATNTQAAAAANAADAAAADSQAAGAAAAPAGGAVQAAKHRDSAVHRLCHCQWQPEQVCQVLSVLKGMALTPEQLKSLLAKAIRACRNAGLQQLPPILYQVLLLSGSTSTMRCYALRLIMSLFDLLESQQGAGAAAAAACAAAGAAGAEDGEPQQQPQQQQQQAANTLPSAVLMQVQATLLMHVSTMLRYDGSLGSEWFKWASGEAGSSSTNYFLLQVLLTMSRHPKHEKDVLQLLKRRIMQACEEEAGGSSGGSIAGGCSGWMSGLQQVNKCPSIQEMQQGLIKAIRSSCYASELVAPGLLQLADALISTRCSSLLHVVLAMKQQRGACSLPPQAPPAARAVVLGLQLLQEVFAAHEEARGEVLKVVQAKLASNDLSAALPIVLLLESITQKQPALLGSYLPQLKECMASFAGLSSDTAMSLLLAVWPLCRVRSDLQDFVVMLLRKMMYRQDVDGRLIATRGFLRLICQHLQDSPLPQPALDPAAASCSQASLSQRASLSSSKGVNLLQELTGVLRRALSQQAPVRQALYEGILQILAADPASSELLSELLLPHLRTYLPEDDQQLPPLLLHKCAQLSQGDAVLVEPLPALLSCVHNLSRTEQRAGTDAGRGPGSLGGSENWRGLVEDEEQQAQELSTSETLKALFRSVRARMGQCQLDHFELPCAADMSPLQPDGLLAQLQCCQLLGSLQVVIEAAVADVGRMIEQQPDADLRDGGAVNKLGAELMRLFSLHSDVYQLAMEGSKAGSKRGKKAGGAAAEGVSQPATAPAPAAGQKRLRPSDSFVPVHKQRPRFSAACLAQLCSAIMDNGLMQLPSSYDVSNPDHHAQLARETGFRACVLRSCASLLEDAQAAAASALLLQEGEGREGEGLGAPAAAEVLELGPALFKVTKLIMQTATAGGRPSSRPANSGSSGAAGEGRKAAAAAAAAGDGCETLEHLSATALLQLLRLADATEQLGVLFSKLPVDTGAAGTSAQQGQAGSSNSNAGDGAAGVAAAVMPRLPQLLACTDSLLQQGCFKEAQVMVECLALLSKRLVAPVPVSGGAAAGGQQQQQQQEPAYAAVSRWAHEALQQEAPDVKSVPLVRGLLDLFIRYHGKDCVVAVKVTMEAINEVVGDTEGDTQATQDHGTILPMLLAGKTAQPAALTPLCVISEGLEQLEKLAAANLKGGVFQDGDSATTAKARRRLAAAMCKRLQDLLTCLRVLVGTIVAMPAVIDQQTRIATRAYKLLATLTKAYVIPKKQPNQGAAEAAATAGRALSPEFEALVGYMHKDLTPCLNHALKDLGSEESNASLARVKKDAKLMPALVYAMEGWEKQLVSTGKSANKNLLRDAKRSFCRDFKVKTSAAAAAADGQPGQGLGTNMAAAAAAAGGGGGGVRQLQGGRKQPAGAGRVQGGAARSQQQQQPAGSRGSGASHSRGAGSRGSTGGQPQQQQEEEEDEEMGEAVEGEEGEEEEEGEAQEYGGEEEEGGDQAENVQQMAGGKVAAGTSVGGLRAPLQRRQA